MSTSVKHDGRKPSGFTHLPITLFLGGVEAAGHAQPAVAVRLTRLLYDLLTRSDTPRVPFELAVWAGPALAHGAAKYGPGNWRISGFRASRLLEAAARHLLGVESDPFAETGPTDSESGLPHLSHAAAMLAFAHVVLQQCPDLDDRADYDRAGTRISLWL